MATKEELQRLKDKIDCRELIQSLGIAFKGTNISCLNPSHPDRNPSMAVYRDHALCFSCGYNLDAIGILKNIKGYTFQDSVEHLALKYSEYSYKAEKTYPKIFKQNNNTKNTDDNSIKDQFWEIIDGIKPTKEAIEWLSKRKISVDLAWKLGCRDITPAIKDIANLIEKSNTDKLRKNHFLGETGNLWSPILNMIKGNVHYSGLIIPTFDLNQKIFSFRWRFFNPIVRTNNLKEVKIKVLGQPSCSLAPVGLNFAQNIKNKEEIYICEGEPDWLSLNTLFYEQNINNKIAIGLCAFSSKWDPAWTSLISEFKKVFFCLHNTDKAKKTSDIIHNSLIEISPNHEESLYWENNVFEHYFEEKMDINDLLLSGKLNLCEINFNKKNCSKIENNQSNIIKIAPMDIKHICNTSPPNLEFVFPGLLRGIVGSVVSTGGTGKSMWAIQACAAIACGVDTLEFKNISQGKSVFISGEDPEEITNIRVNTFSKLLNQEQINKLDANCKIFSLLGMNPNIFDKKWYDWVKNVSQNSKLVIIDTLRIFHNEDENDGGKMSELIKVLGSISRECNTSIIYLHHTNKNSANNSSASDQQASRGSSVLTDNIKLQINLATMTQIEANEYNIDEKDRKFYVKYVYAKMNYGPPIPDRWLKRDDSGILTPCDLPKKDILPFSKNLGGKKGGI